MRHCLQNTPGLQTLQPGVAPTFVWAAYNGSCPSPALADRGHAPQFAPSSVLPANTHGAVDGRDEGLVVADLSYFGRPDDGVYRLVRGTTISIFTFGRKGRRVPRAAVDLSVALLAAEAFHLGRGHALQADVGQCRVALPQLDGLDDGAARSQARRTWNMAPPSADRPTSMEPRCRSTARRTIVRPSPAPRERRPLWKGSNNWSQLRAGSPAPPSLTVIVD